MQRCVMLVSLLPIEYFFLTVFIIYKLGGLVGVSEIEPVADVH